MSSSQCATSSTQLIEGLVADMSGEREQLKMVLSQLSGGAWSSATPSPRWSVHDQIAHLAYFDGIARLSVESPAEFEKLRDGIVDLQVFIDAIGAQHNYLNGAAMLEWWLEESERLGRAAMSANSSQRLPWFGPSMSLASMLTARIMETWAHGQDIHDALGVQRLASPRLRHIARLGVGTFAHSFTVRGRGIPTEPVAVVLDDVEGGDSWVWGDPSARNVVTGTALDFCLVVTQRRHVDDTDLDVRGAVAGDWMVIAQAFAGPPGVGRTPQIASPTNSVSTTALKV